MSDFLTQMTLADAGVQVPRIPVIAPQRTAGRGNLGATPTPPDPMYNQGVGYWVIQRGSDGIGDAAIHHYTHGIGSVRIAEDFEIGEGTAGPQGNFVMNERPNVGYNRKDRGVFRIFSPHVHNWNGE